MKKNIIHKYHRHTNTDPTLIGVVDPKTVAKGDWVKIADDGRYGGFTKRALTGKVVQVTDVRDRDVSSDAKTIDFVYDGRTYSYYGYEWFIFAEEPKDFEAEAAPDRPMVDFSGPSRATARKYAANNISRANEPRTNTLFGSAASGDKVDAYALNEAVLDAMRHCATRAGQSMARRQIATEVAHIGHIVQAVLENHADSLPAYAEGERSRKVADLESSILTLTAKRDEDLAEIERLRGLSRDQAGIVERSDARYLEACDRIESIREERDEIQAVLNYAFEQMSDTAKQRVLGFWDGTRGDQI